MLLLRSWIVGLAPEAGRFFFYWFLIFWFHQFSVALFRLTGAALRPLTLANAGAVLLSMVLMTFGEIPPFPSLSSLLNCRPQVLLASMLGPLRPSRPTERM